MKTIKIYLDSIESIKSFTNAISKFDFDFDLSSGRYVVDAKSIMGVLSLNLGDPIDLTIHAEGSDLAEAEKALKDYIAE